MKEKIFDDNKNKPLSLRIQNKLIKASDLLDKIDALMRKIFPDDIELEFSDLMKKPKYKYKK